MPFAYPVLLELSGRRCVVIGAMRVRERKVEGLLAGGADDVGGRRGPSVSDSRRSRLDGVTVRTRAWRPDDLDGAFLVRRARPRIRRSATRSRAKRAPRAPRQRRGRHPELRLGDAGDRPPRRAVVAIGTGGASPALAKKVRERLEAGTARSGPRCSPSLARCGARPCRSLPDFANARRRWREALDLDEAAALVRAGRSDELRDRLLDRLLGRGRRVSGLVYLVGAGPGDPELITVRGAEVLGPPTSSCTTGSRRPRCSTWRRPAPSASTSARSPAARRCHRRRSTHCWWSAARGRDGRAAERRRPVRVRPRRRRGARVRRGRRRRARCPGRDERDRGAGRRGDPRHAPRRGTASPWSRHRPPTATTVDLASVARRPTRWSC